MERYEINENDKRLIDIGLEVLEMNFAAVCRFLKIDLNSDIFERSIDRAHTV